MSNVKDFLRRKDIVITPQRYLIEALGAMAQGLFASLLIGTIIKTLGQQTGLSRSALGNYESGNFKDISPFAITTLAQFYGVSTDYLLGVTELKNHPNAELHELHLSDAMLELLKSGRINN